MKRGRPMKKSNAAKLSTTTFDPSTVKAEPFDYYQPEEISAVTYLTNRVDATERTTLRKDTYLSSWIPRTEMRQHIVYWQSVGAVMLGMVAIVIVLSNL